MGSYFHGCHPELEGRLERHFESMRERIGGDAGVAGKVDALVLGGGYGRGEGGVFESEGEVSLYNDLDYFLFSDDADAPCLRRWAVQVEAEASVELGVDVEIKRLPIAEVEEGVAGSMTFHDLVAGHHLVWGDGRRLERLRPGLDASGIGAGEATRLLWNRGSGLYFALCKIDAREGAEFVERNHQKCALALCDALLCTRGRYSSSVVERHRRVLAGEAGDVDDELSGLYEAAVEFKLRPRPREMSWAQRRAENFALCRRWEKVFLQVEAMRTGRSFDSLGAYASRRGRLFGGEVPLWKAPLFALRDVVRHRGFLRPVWDYPRAALMRALCCLLDQENHPAALGRVGLYLPPGGREERPGATALARWEHAYEDWWRRYS